MITKYYTIIKLEVMMPLKMWLKSWACLNVHIRSCCLFVVMLPSIRLPWGLVCPVSDNRESGTRELRKIKEEKPPSTNRLRRPLIYFYSLYAWTCLNVSCLCPQLCGRRIFGQLMRIELNWTWAWRLSSGLNIMMLGLTAVVDAGVLFFLYGLCFPFGCPGL